MSPRSNMNMNKSSFHGSMPSSPCGQSVGQDRSAVDTTKSQYDLETTVNNSPIATSTTSSPGSGTKQKWFASLRCRASHIPMPTTSTMMPIRNITNSNTPTSTMSRFFRTPPHGKKEDQVSTLKGDVSPSTRSTFKTEDQDQNHETLRAPPPKLVLPSFDPLSDVGTKYDKEHPKKDVPASAACETRSPGPRAAKYSVKCDVYYPPTPWEPARTDHFENATAALSSYCLGTLPSEDRMYRKIILWTCYTPRADPSRRQQRFTALPSYLKPDRNALGRDEKYDWAIIVLREGHLQSRIPAVYGGQLGSLQSALARIGAMGYYVDV